MRHLNSEIVSNDIQYYLYVCDSALLIYSKNKSEFLQRSIIPRPSAPITVHRDGSQQQFSTVKYSSTTPLNSTSSLTGTWVTLVTVMNTCKICQILVKREFSRSRWSEID